MGQELAPAESAQDLVREVLVKAVAVSQIGPLSMDLNKNGVKSEYSPKKTQKHCEFFKFSFLILKRWRVGVGGWLKYQGTCPSLGSV